MNDESTQQTASPTQPSRARGRATSSPRSFGIGGDRDKGGDRQNDRTGGRRGKGRDRAERRPRAERVRPEFDQKSIDVRRVARVVAGGRRFSFSVAMIVGDHKGRVGVGTGKAGDMSMAMEKAAKDAKKHLIAIPLTKSSSIAHAVKAKSSSAVVEITPAPSRGLVAGSAVRNVLELAGVTDVNAKIWSGSKNRLNMARAAVEALRTLRPRRRMSTPVSHETPVES